MRETRYTVYSNIVRLNVFRSNFPVPLVFVFSMTILSWKRMAENAREMKPVTHIKLAFSFHLRSAFNTDVK